MPTCVNVGPTRQRTNRRDAHCGRKNRSRSISVAATEGAFSIREQIMFISRIAILFAVIVASPAAPVSAQEAKIQSVHAFLLEALPRADASYEGQPISTYTGANCSSSIDFGKLVLSINWSQITDAAWDTSPALKLTGRFDGKQGLSTRSIALKSPDLAMRLATAVVTLKRECDPLRSSGY